jgi:hypothetical protein
MSVMAAVYAMAGTQVLSGISQMRHAQYNASLYQKQAEMVDVQKKIESQQYDRMKRRMAGTITARTAKAGTTLSGSPMAVLLDNLTQIEYDQAIGQYNLNINKFQAQSAASMTKSQGRAALFGGFTNAFSTIMTGRMMTGTNTTETNTIRQGTWGSVGSYDNVYKYR